MTTVFTNLDEARMSSRKSGGTTSRIRNYVDSLLTEPGQCVLIGDVCRSPEVLAAWNDARLTNRKVVTAYRYTYNAILNMAHVHIEGGIAQRVE